MRRAWLLALVACAHAAPNRVEFTQPAVITAGEPDEATLFDAASVAFKAGRYADAARDFDKVWQAYPGSDDERVARFDAALSHERLGNHEAALTRYLQNGNDVDAQFHAAVCEYRLGRSNDAAKRLQALAVRQDLAPQQRAEALVQEGVISVEQGQRSEGEQLLRAALQLLDDRSDPGVAAQAEFWLGESYRGSFQESKLAPATMDEKTLAEALESKAQLLLSAQGHYLRAVRKGDGEWATAAGYRIGELYESFHDELLAAEVPPGLDAEQRRLYQSELRQKVKNLVSKAIRIYEETLDAAQRTGASNDYVQKTNAALERLRKLLVDEPPPPPRGGPSNG